MTLSVLMVTYNSADVVEGALRSIKGIAEEVLVGDGGSRDGTVEVVKKYGAKIIRQIRPILLPQSGIHDAVIPKRYGNSIGTIRPMNLGERKQELVEKAKEKWILVLDADERVSEELKREITSITRLLPPSEVKKTVAFRIPYQNYVFGRPVYYGGEKYAKVRLFRKGFARISPEPLHEEVRVVGEVGELRGKIHHHSYRTPRQLLSKFTRYAWIGSRMEIASPSLAGSRNDMLRRLFLYGPHMFWARFIKEEGYKDGWRGLVLALAFGYMEGLTYWLMLL